ncbi:Sigma70_r4_2 domain-containing protein [Rhodovastum atsumiense]|nr:Sigma70_r4_2 domain-containing protein [Rhodovastum atsumiense]
MRRTNFKAWTHRILRNRFIGNLRKHRPTSDIEDAPLSVVGVSGGHDGKIELKEAQRLLGYLPSDQREGLLLIVLEGMSYGETVEIADCVVGTMKSCVFRARRQLQA